MDGATQQYEMETYEPDEMFDKEDSDQKVFKEQNLKREVENGFKNNGQE